MPPSKMECCYFAIKKKVGGGTGVGLNSYVKYKIIGRGTN
jgi:hypothetical protein